MKKYFLLLGIFFFLSSPLRAQDYLYGTVKFVPDGDTIILKSGVSVRYIGIDCPEMNHKKSSPQPFAKEARSFNEKLVKGKKLKIVFGSQKKDRFQRVLGYVYLPNGRMVNELILEKGMGWVYFHKDNLELNSKFLLIQKTAYKNKQGIWSVLNSKTTAVKLNKKSKRFHLTNCGNVKKGKYEISHISDAFLKGYSPARGCIENVFSFR